MSYFPIWLYRNISALFCNPADFSRTVCRTRSSFLQPHRNEHRWYRYIDTIRMREPCPRDAETYWQFQDRQGSADPVSTVHVANHRKGPGHVDNHRTSNTSFLLSGVPGTPAKNSDESGRLFRMPMPLVFHHPG